MRVTTGSKKKDLIIFVSESIPPAWPGDASNEIRMALSQREILERGRLIAIGAKIFYTPTGAYEELGRLPRSYETPYAAYDPATTTWTP